MAIASTTISNHHTYSTDGALTTWARGQVQAIQDLFASAGLTRVVASGSTPARVDAASAPALTVTGEFPATTSNHDWFSDYYALPDGDLPLYIRYTYRIQRHSGYYDLGVSCAASLEIDANGLTGASLVAAGTPTVTSSSQPNSSSFTARVLYAEGAIWFNWGVVASISARTSWLYERYRSPAGPILTGTKAGAAGIGFDGNGGYHQMWRSEGGLSGSASESSSSLGVAPVTRFQGGPSAMGASNGTGLSSYGNSVAVYPIHGWTTEPAVLKQIVWGNPLPLETPFTAPFPIAPASSGTFVRTPQFAYSSSAVVPGHLAVRWE